MADTSDGNAPAGQEPEDIDPERSELMVDAKSIARELECLIDNAEERGSHTSDPSGIRQKQKASLRVLRMYIDEVEALSAAITEAQLSDIQGRSMDDGKTNKPRGSP